VIKLPAGSNTQTVLPEFVHASLISDVAGAVWVVDAGNEQLVKLAAGSDKQTVLPFPNLGVHGDIQTVDNAGNVYGANGGGVYPSGACCIPVHVVKLAVGSDSPTVLPFTHLHGVIDIAVDAAGGVYVVDADHNRVVKLAAGSDTPAVLPFNGINHPVRVAVDTAGNDPADTSARR
jgi:streptogramin lyase